MFPIFLVFTYTPNDIVLPRNLLIAKNIKNVIIVTRGSFNKTIMRYYWNPNKKITLF